MEETNFVQPAIPRFDGYYDHWAMLMENFLRSKEYWHMVEIGIPAAAAEGGEGTEAQRKLREDAKLKDLKDSMRQKFQGSTKVKRAQLQTLRREFEVLGMREGEKVNEYFARTLTVANKMKAHGERMEDLVIVEKILRSMTRKYDYVVCSIEESNDLTTMTIDELQSSLLVHEQRMHAHDVGDEQVLKVTHENTSGARGRGRGMFRGRGRGRGRQGFNKALVECYKCHKLGHFQYECPNWERTANYAELEEEEELLLMAYVEINNSKREDVWFLDSGCSNHMCGNRKWFSNLDETFKHSVKLGNNTRMAVTGKGNIKLEVHGMTQGNYKKKAWQFSYSMESVECIMKQRVVLSDSPTCLQTSTEDLAHLWHRRYGHLSYKGLRTLHYKKMVKGLPQVVAPTREKSETFTMFKQYKNLVEKETGLSILCLRTDRGGEFTSIEFNEFCKSSGIKRQLTAAYSPQQNGVAERRNRTIMNLVRSVLSEKRVPKSYWPEAVKWITHVLNRSPTLVVQDVTPEEAWSGIKPNVDYFRVFGCIAHAHIPDAKRTKFDDKSCKCVFLGRTQVGIGEGSIEEEKQDVLVWGDSEENEQAQSEEETDGVVAQDDGVVPNQSSGSSSSSNNGSIPSSCQGSPQSPQIVDEERNRRQPIWMQGYVSGEGLSEEEQELHNLAVFTPSDDPSSFEEAVVHSRWREAMRAEIEAIETNDTWQLTSLPKGVKKIGVKWVFKTKYNEHGKVDKCKARLVAKGYAQQFGIDYTEVYAPVARWDTIRLIVALAAQKNWTIFQLDVKSAFLHGELNEDVYIEQPQGFEQKGEEEKVYKLKKALYGLKQAPRAWYSRIEGYFVKEGFERCSYEHTLFVKIEGEGKMLIVSLYVDDQIFTGNDMSMIEKFKSSMMHEFEMTDLGEMKYFLGVEIRQSAEGIHLCQSKYAREVIERFGMGKSNPVRNPIVPGSKLSMEAGGAVVDGTLFKQLVGSLMYLTATRPDLIYVVCLISRFMAHPREAHLSAAKRVLRYLKGTTELGVFYRRGVDDELVGYTDSDYAGDMDGKRSTSGFVFMLSGGAVSWSSRKQHVVTLSTTEAEYVAAAGCACQSVWMRRVLNKLGYSQCKCVTMFCDNSSTIKLSKNPVFHGRSKHIDVRFHFLRDLTKDGVVELKFYGSKEQIADILTKPLKMERFEKLRELLGVKAKGEVN
uniref:Copia-type polyprotein n=1 Tax=Rosa rugosa TaxID=74645 RepID=J7FWR9_ROSRU|nr:copia-type polyprotein [Rosa rugosa]